MRRVFILLFLAANATICPALDYQYDQRVQVPSNYADPFVHKENTSSLVKNTAFNYMNELIGWCSYQKAAILIDIITTYKPEKIVEIGVWGGKSLVPMACALKANKKGKIYGIDPWNPVDSLEWVMNSDNINYWSRADYKGVLNHLTSMIEKFELRDQIELIRTTSAQAPEIADLDILHIDGNHSDVTTYLDVTKWGPLVKSGGWIIFDDMTWYENGKYTAARAVGWLDEHCIRFAQIREDCDWGIWFKP